MPRGMAAHLLVGGIFGPAARVARFDLQHAGHLGQQVLHAPETASGENRGFGPLLFLRLLPSGGRLFAGFRFGFEEKRNRIDAVARILRGKSLVQKHMPQVSSAFGAGDLGAPSVGVGRPHHGARNLVIETGPAAPRVELVGGTVQRRAALAAVVYARLAVVIISARKGRFGTLVDDHTSLFRCQRFHILSVYGSRQQETDC